MTSALWNKDYISDLRLLVLLLGLILAAGVYMVWGLRGASCTDAACRSDTMIYIYYFIGFDQNSYTLYFGNNKTK